MLLNTLQYFWLPLNIFSYIYWKLAGRSGFARVLITNCQEEEEVTEKRQTDVSFKSQKFDSFLLISLLLSLWEAYKPRLNDSRDVF